MVFVFVGWMIFRHVKDDFGKLLVFSLMGVIGMQATINIAVATVSVPTKGIALPFISAGGSGLIFAGMAIGIVCSVNKYSEWNLLQDSSEA
jgi:cell division protein FtsW